MANPLQTRPMAIPRTRALILTLSHPLTLASAIWDGDDLATAISIVAYHGGSPVWFELKYFDPFLVLDEFFGFLRIEKCLKLEQTLKQTLKLTPNYSLMVYNHQYRLRVRPLYQHSLSSQIKMSLM
ncbi:hypothetical protein ACSBR2_018084 [Camellia fascicularis]